MRVAIIISVLLLTSCASIQYKRAERANTVESYQYFLSRYGDSRYVEDANKRINEIEDWHDTLQANTADAYESFISKHPASFFSATAGHIYEEIALSEEEQKYADKLLDRLKKENSLAMRDLMVSQIPLKYKKIIYMPVILLHLGRINNIRLNAEEYEYARNVLNALESSNDKENDDLLIAQIPAKFNKIKNLPAINEIASRVNNVYLSESEVTHAKKLIYFLKTSTSAIMQAHATSLTISTYSELKHIPFIARYVHAIESLRIAKIDIIATYRTSKCTEILIGELFGNSCTYYSYAGKLFKGDLVYVDMNKKDRVRTLHKETNLLRFAHESGGNSFDGWSVLLGKEVFGSTREFSGNNGYYFNDMFSSDITLNNAPESYHPTALAKKTQGFEGGDIGLYSR